MDTATTLESSATRNGPAFRNSYARLPEKFWSRGPANPVASPRLIRVNQALARQLGIDTGFLESEAGLQMLAGNRFPENAEPIALAYAGHQFGHFSPQLGDGRALLIGEIEDQAGTLRDLQLKGSGPTIFSRRGDGRAALGPVLREYIVSEAMFALGLPTTRVLAAVATGEPVYRERALPGAVLTRVAASHIRIGTFEFFASRGDVEAVRTLADYAIERHYPQAAEREDRYLAFLDAVVAAQADLVARWMLIGFIHGVMNTDNMAISGETIDYGPCAFMDAYHPATVFSSIDEQGRYAYGNQPQIAVWNLARLAEAMLGLFDADEEAAVKKAEGALKGFQPRYDATFMRGLRAKLGLTTERAEDAPLVRGLFETMAANQADFTNTFRGLAWELDPATAGSTRALFQDPAAFDAWLERWRERVAVEGGDTDMCRNAILAVNPKYIARNHRVEAAIAAATDNSDFRPFELLLDVLAKPFDEQPGWAEYALPPEPHERVLQTFCGT